jgi:phage-related protein
VELIEGFRYSTQYQVRDKHDGRTYEKTLVIFLARLKHDISIGVTEHGGYQWFAWNPPHQIQERTIDPLLAAVARFLPQWS